MGRKVPSQGGQASARKPRRDNNAQRGLESPSLRARTEEEQRGARGSPLQRASRGRGAGGRRGPGGRVPMGAWTLAVTSSRPTILSG